MKKISPLSFVAALSLLIVALSIAYYLVIFLPNKYKAEQEFFQKLLVESQATTTSPFPTSTPTPTPSQTITQPVKNTPNPCSKYDPKEIGKKAHELYQDSYKEFSDELLGDIILKKFLGC